MSIILTAGKKAVAKPKSSKPKKKKEHNHKTVPPISTERTVVWYWLLEGAPTTVMYTKETSEVWCNGATLETLNGFGDDVCGGNVDFTIFTEKSGRHHHATIVKVTVGASSLSHQLFVDGFMILEHMGQPPDDSVTQMTMEMGADAFAANAAPPPPSYDDLYTQAQTKKIN